VKALSIKQPWAWAILHAGKDIENRTWKTDYRGRVLIHTGKKFDAIGWEALKDATRFHHKVPDKSEFLFGGIVGSVEIVDVVENSPSPWFQGPYGFVLRNPVEYDFFPLRGQLGFFEVGKK